MEDHTQATPEEFQREWKRREGELRALDRPLKALMEDQEERLGSLGELPALTSPSSQLDFEVQMYTFHMNQWNAGDHNSGTLDNAFGWLGNLDISIDLLLEGWPLPRDSVVLDEGERGLLEDMKSRVEGMRQDIRNRVELLSMGVGHFVKGAPRENDD